MPADAAVQTPANSMKSLKVLDEVQITRTPAARPGFARYDVRDVVGYVGTVIIREDRDSAHLLWFVRTYLREHPPRLVRAARRILTLLR